MTKEIIRCPWSLGHPLLTEYHDCEWGTACHDDTTLLEYLILDAAQAGLSWLTVLKKRDNYRRAFVEYNAEKIARFSEVRIVKLLLDPGIIRNQFKVRSAVSNARSFLAAQEEFGSFDSYIWRFVDGTPRRNKWPTQKEIPAESAESIAMSKDMKKRGFAFCGPTICYAFMQAAGMVNDHLVTCHRYHAVAKKK